MLRLRVGIRGFWNCLRELSELRAFGKGYGIHKKGHISPGSVVIVRFLNGRGIS
jgi:hypothetical protein